MGMLERTLLPTGRPSPSPIENKSNGAAARATVVCARPRGRAAQPARPASPHGCTLMPLAVLAVSEALRQARNRWVITTYGHYETQTKKWTERFACFPQCLTPHPKRKRGSSLRLTACKYERERTQPAEAGHAKENKFSAVVHQYCKVVKALQCTTCTSHNQFVHVEIENVSYCSLQTNRPTDNTLRGAVILKFVNKAIRRVLYHERDCGALATEANNRSSLEQRVQIALAT